MNEFKKRVKDLQFPAVLTLLLFLLLRFVIFVGYVPTESMAPTLAPGSYIVGTRLISNFEKGDIIVFKHDHKYLVKRVAACPGDEIDLRDLVYMKTVPIPVWEEPVIIVPDGCYFVLGDNTENSIDSRYWADPFVPGNVIVAEVLMY